MALNRHALNANSSFLTFCLHQEFSKLEGVLSKACHDDDAFSTQHPTGTAHSLADVIHCEAHQVLCVAKKEKNATN